MRAEKSLLELCKFYRSIMLPTAVEKYLIVILLFTEVDTLITKNTMLGAKYYDGKKISIPISDDAHNDLIEHWVFQAYSSFLSAFATKR